MIKLEIADLDNNKYTEDTYLVIKLNDDTVEVEIGSSSVRIPKESFIKVAELMK